MRLLLLLLLCWITHCPLSALHCLSIITFHADLVLVLVIVVRILAPPLPPHSSWPLPAPLPPPLLGAFSHTPACWALPLVKHPATLVHVFQTCKFSEPTARVAS